MPPVVFFSFFSALKGPSGREVGGPGGEVRFEEWDAYEAGSKKKTQSLQTFFFSLWQHDRVLWIFFPPSRSAFTVTALKQRTTEREKNNVNFYASFPLQDKKKTTFKKKTCRELINGLWTDSKQICELTIVQDVFLYKTVYVISKCRKNVFCFLRSFFVTDSVYLLVWKNQAA